jgi:hypothetical protein
MTASALDAFVAQTRSTWGPLSSDLVAACRQRLETLAQASPAEAWLKALHDEAAASQELYRDPAHGFVLQAHTEAAGVYRPPHDHGQSWVVYAVQQGEVEMRTYSRVVEADGAVRLVRRDETLVRPGQAMAFLPADIHDTRCLKGPALLLRFTERDLKQEDRDGRLTRYVDRNGVWTSGAAA